MKFLSLIVFIIHFSSAMGNETIVVKFLRGHEGNLVFKTDGSVKKEDWLFFGNIKFSISQISEKGNVILVKPSRVASFRLGEKVELEKIDPTSVIGKIKVKKQIKERLYLAVNSAMPISKGDVLSTKSALGRIFVKRASGDGRRVIGNYYSQFQPELGDEFPIYKVESRSKKLSEPNDALFTQEKKNDIKKEKKSTKWNRYFFMNMFINYLPGKNYKGDFTEITDLSFIGAEVDFFLRLPKVDKYFISLGLDYFLPSSGVIQSTGSSPTQVENIFSPVAINLKMHRLFFNQLILGGGGGIQIPNSNTDNLNNIRFRPNIKILLSLDWHLMEKFILGATYQYERFGVVSNLFEDTIVSQNAYFSIGYHF